MNFWSKAATEHNTHAQEAEKSQSKNLQHQNIKDQQSTVPAPTPASVSSSTQHLTKPRINTTNSDELVQQPLNMNKVHFIAMM